MLRRSKIVATLGPASRKPDILHDLFKAGVNVLRVNFSHASASAVQDIHVARKIAQELNHPIAIMADLQGPKIRIGKFKDSQVTLLDNQKFIVNCQDEDLIGDSKTVFVNYPDLCDEVKIGDRFLLSDGLIELNVDDIKPPEIHCTVIEGGPLSNFKGFNRKGGGLAARTLTKKDKLDLKTAVDAEVDFISLSFVKDADDIQLARDLLKEYGAKTTLIIAKIERCEALHHLSAIIQAADGVMVARGDLGVEVGAAEIPAIQKEIIKQTRQMDKVVITATQMMESMIENPQPTRAEVSDVANAILDGTDAVMLSAETAVGKHPVKVIKIVNKTCLSAEKHADFFYYRDPDSCHYQRADQAIAMATIHAANHFPVKAIIALTESGASAVWMSRQHCKIPIFAVTANKRTVARLCLVNNIYPVFYDFKSFDIQTLNQSVIQYLQKEAFLTEKGYVLFTRGTVIGKPGGTNCMEIMMI